MVRSSQIPSALSPQKIASDTKTGVILVSGSAVIWSFGGAIARYISVNDSWTIVFWRAVWAALFLLGFLLIRDGLRGTVRLFQILGFPGIGVALCFAAASTSFVVALSFTTVANILLMLAGVPLIAALIAWLLFREKVAVATWIAIGTVILGIAVMVSESLSTRVSLIGNALALLISVAFALATVITRRYSKVQMIPACCLATIISACVSAVLASRLGVTASDMGLLFTFGALNLGLGMALFVTGAPLVPSAIAALLATLETVLGPIWVWVIHGETPSLQTAAGGAIVVLALVSHLLWQYNHQRGVVSAAMPH